jgi:uncharacterized Zn finger protein
VSTPTPPDAARDLLLQVVRTEAEERPCPACGRALDGCELIVDTMELDRIVVQVTCAVCGGVTQLHVTPSEDGGTASIR